MFALPLLTLLPLFFFGCNKADKEQQQKQKSGRTQATAEEILRNYMKQNPIYDCFKSDILEGAVTFGSSPPAMEKVMTDRAMMYIAMKIGEQAVRRSLSPSFDMFDTSQVNNVVDWREVMDLDDEELMRDTFLLTWRRMEKARMETPETNSVVLNRQSMKELIRQTRFDLGQPRQRDAFNRLQKKFEGECQGVYVELSKALER